MSNVRVSCILGKAPVLFVCPYGQEESHTGTVAETAARCLGGNAVVNYGFLRADSVDVANDRADCNRVDHVRQDVVREEFLRPVQRTVSRLCDKFEGAAACAHVFVVRGCHDAPVSVGARVDVILGYGLGAKKHSLTCYDWRKSLFVDLWRHHNGGHCYVGRGDGPFAGRDANTLNQYYRKHSLQYSVQSMQLTFPGCLRSSSVAALSTGNQLALVVEDYLRCHVNGYGVESTDRFI